MSKETEKKARELREAAAKERRRKQARTNIFLAGGVGVIVVLLVAIVAVAISSSQKGKGGNADGPLVNPSSATASGTLPVGKETAPVTMTIYLDYMCPACKQFEQNNKDSLTKLIEDGTLRVELHPLNFLDQVSQGTRYSTRAANAVATVADKAPDKVWEFNSALYAHQPAENTEGLTDKFITEIADGVGVPKAVYDTFVQGTFEPWAKASNEAANKAGVTGTPTIKINGEKFDGNVYDPNVVADAVKAAAEKAGSK